MVVARVSIISEAHSASICRVECLCICGCLVSRHTEDWEGGQWCCDTASTNERGDNEYCVGKKCVGSNRGPLVGVVVELACKESGETVECFVYGVCLFG
jgi:hypothetical protein